ncbi:MAG: hypothetical protein KGM42_09010 [Hyphomicrobiales bacterium]|nr:hypothetical protein [Hyphomicrobiales bacterium]
MAIGTPSACEAARDSINQKTVRFLPWIPRGFGGGPLRRLLVLGESHYGKPAEDVPSLTNDVVSCYIAGANFRFFTTLSMVLTKEDRSQIDRYAIWSRIAFYNYVQWLVSEKARVTPSESMFNESQKAFFDVIDEIRPTHLIACGMRLWNHMPNFTSDGAHITHDGKQYLYGPYARNWGTLLALGINHPSSAFVQSRWRPVIKSFLSMR